MYAPSWPERSPMPPERPVVAVTGSAGFSGRNLTVRLGEAGYTFGALTRQTPLQDAVAAIGRADVVFHLAGAVRPDDPSAFAQADAYGRHVADAVARGGRRPFVILSSSTQAGEDTAYGRSRRTIETV